MSMTAAELKAARDRLRGAIREPVNGDYRMTIDEIVSLTLAVEAAQGLAPRGLLDIVPTPSNPNRSDER